MAQSCRVAYRLHRMVTVRLAVAWQYARTERLSQLIAQCCNTLTKSVQLLQLSITIGVA